MKKYLSGNLSLGQTVATPHALEVLSEKDISAAIMRHRNCNWGNVCDEDWQSNNEAVVHGLRVLSAYISEACEKFWVITEADRSYTTVLMPEDY